MLTTNPILSEADLAFFAANNWLALDGCVVPELVATWTREALRERGIDPAQRGTWPTCGHGWLSSIAPPTRVAELAHFAPRAWAAIAELVGGEERIDQPVTITDDLVMNFDLAADQEWIAPSAATGGWHIDGDFNHFLDSPEIGLLVIINFTDVVERGGATWIAADSIAPAARALREHPQGLSALALRSDFQFQTECSRFVPLTGPAGRVYLMHPLMLHCTSWNPLRRLRAIRNLGVPLREPMRFAAEQRPLSPVEAATVRALGVERLDFTPPLADLRRPTDHDTGALQPRPVRRSVEERRASITVGPEELASLR